MPHIFIPAAFKTSIALSLSEKLKIMYQFCRTSSTLFKPPDDDDEEPKPVISGEGLCE